VRLTLLLLLWVPVSLVAQVRYEFEQAAMGTRVRISLYAEGAGVAGVAAEAAFARIREIEQVASDYLPESELSLLCLAKEPRVVSADLAELLSLGRGYAEQTEGAFDPTVGHLSQLWRRAKRKGELPAEELRLRAVRQTGWRRLAMSGGKVTLEPQTQLDLGGIAKGYAADAALAVLKKRGLGCAVVAASGDLALGSAPPGKRGWEVWVRAFEGAETGDGRLRLELADCGLSTSGDLHQFVELGGQRFSHIIDPQTGLGLTSRIACSVVAHSAVESDALATALCVLGVVRGREVVARCFPGLRVRWATPLGAVVLGGF
jgi:FAD:protein FMN transferase